MANLKSSYPPLKTHKIVYNNINLERNMSPVCDYFALRTQFPLCPYFCALGPATPAPITLGKSSCPMLNSSPMDQLTVATIAIVNPVSNQNGTLTSFF